MDSGGYPGLFIHDPEYDPVDKDMKTTTKMETGPSLVTVVFWLSISTIVISILYVVYSHHKVRTNV